MEAELQFFDGDEVGFLDVVLGAAPTGSLAGRQMLLAMAAGAGAASADAPGHRRSASRRSSISP